MSQRDNFAGGFFLGTLVGGVVGGILGVLVSSKIANQDALPEESFSKLENKPNKKRKQLPTEQSIEVARRGLEDKIAQLNDAIDDVRQQLSNVNGASKSEEDRVMAQD